MARKDPLVQLISFTGKAISKSLKEAERAAKRREREEARRQRALQQLARANEREAKANQAARIRALKEAQKALLASERGDYEDRVSDRARLRRRIVSEIVR